MHLFWCLTDPTLYYDKKKQIIHAIVHNWQGGGHAASHDHGKSWRWYGGNCSAAKGPSSLDWSRSVWPPTFTVLDSDRIETPRRRERPHILVDKNYVVTALTTAVQLGKHAVLVHETGRFGSAHVVLRHLRFAQLAQMALTLACLPRKRSEISTSMFETVLLSNN